MLQQSERAIINADVSSVYPLSAVNLYIWARGNRTLERSNLIASPSNTSCTYSDVVEGIIDKRVGYTTVPESDTYVTCSRTMELSYRP